MLRALAFGPSQQLKPVKMLGLGKLQKLIDQALPEADNFAILTAIKDNLGLANIAYFAQHLPPLTKVGPYIEVTYPIEWVNHYKSHQYINIDPVLREPMRSILPTDWSTLSRSTPKIRQLFLEAERFGIGRQGLTIPIRGAMGELAYFSVTMNASDEEWRTFLNSHMPTLQIVAHFYHNRVLERHGIKMPSIRLSPRELDVLRWAANGKSVNDTATILGLSSHTVQTYLEMARMKLQALNTSHAVARAISRALIPPPD